MRVRARNQRLPPRRHWFPLGNPDLCGIDKNAEVAISPATRSLVITDSASHVRTAAALLQVLDKQATQPAK